MPRPAATRDLESLAPLRPALHLTPPRGWMNDPNGLVKIGDRWHAFYQHDPDALTHGVMHWGHASSADLTSWTHHPIALHPDEHGVIFSGSAVVDDHDRAGFGPGTVIAAFTHYDDGVQSQSLATSPDGLSWTKFAGNPVLTRPVKDFRDPSILWSDGGWTMALAVGDRIEFFRSEDLRSWKSVAEFNPGFAGLGALECPDLVAVSGADSATHVLHFGSDRGGPYGHSGTYSVLGTADHRGFATTGEVRRFDYGPDCYAVQTFSATDEPAPVALGWMSSWRYSNTHPERGYRGTMTIPRRLEVVDGTVRQHPVLPAGTRVDQSPWSSSPDTALLVRAEGDLSVTVAGPDGPAVSVEIARGLVTLVRHTDVAPSYRESYQSELFADGVHQVLVDHGTIEVFAGGGSTVLSALYFCGPDFQVSASVPASATTAADLCELTPTRVL